MIALSRLLITYLILRFCFVCFAQVRCWFQHRHSGAWMCVGCTSWGVNDDIQLPKPKGVSARGGDAAASAGSTGGAVVAHSLASYWFMPPIVWMAVPDLRRRRLAKSLFFPPHSQKSPNTAHSGSPLHEYFICNTEKSHFCSGFVSSFLLSSPLCACVLMSVAVLLQCKLEQQACLTGKELTIKCAGLCPCPTAATTSKESKRGKIDRTPTNNRRETKGGRERKRETERWIMFFFFLLIAAKQLKTKLTKLYYFIYIYFFIQTGWKKNIKSIKNGTMLQQEKIKKREKKTLIIYITTAFSKWVYDKVFFQYN